MGGPLGGGYACRITLLRPQASKQASVSGQRAWRLVKLTSLQPINSMLVDTLFAICHNLCCQSSKTTTLSRANGPNMKRIRHSSLALANPNYPKDNPTVDQTCTCFCIIPSPYINLYSVLYHYKILRSNYAPRGSLDCIGAVVDVLRCKVVVFDRRLAHANAAIEPTGS